MSDNELPDGWVSTEFGDLGQIGSSRRVHKKDWKSEGIPFHRAREIAKLSREGVVQNDLFISPSLFKELSKIGHVPETNDLMITGVGTIGVPYIVKEDDCFYFKDASVLIFKNEHDLNATYLFHFFCSSKCRQGITQGSKGTTVDTLTISRASEIQLPLPPLAEQKRIVAKIEELFSELDAGEESLRRARRQLGVYRQSLLKQAFEGKLTAPWRAQNPDLLESPDQLLTRIKEEREKRYEQRIKEWETEVSEWNANGKPGRKPTKPKALASIQRRVSDESDSIPAQWFWLDLGDASDVTGGLTKNSKRNSLEIRIPYLRVANVYANELRLDEIKDIGVTTAEARKVRLEKGDLLIVEGNGSLEQIGRVASWNGSIKNCGHQNHLIRSRCFPSADYSFVLKFLLSPQGRERIEKQAASTSGLHTLSVSKVHALSIPLCSLPEQQEIVRLLDEQFEVIEQNEREIDAALKRSEALRQSILKKAFTGQLVPQDPTDEPATTLLARIREERAAAAKLAMPKKKAAKRRTAQKRAKS